MIVTKNIEIPFMNNLEEIESKLSNLGIEPLRWSVVHSDNNKLIISVSYEEN